jgi:hypothetical protein
MTTLMQLQEAIERGMRRGESFSTVEDEIIEPSRLSDEAKSALWLYAWSFVDWRAQRREAYAHIAQIAASPAPMPAVTQPAPLAPTNGPAARRAAAHRSKMASASASA